MNIVRYASFLFIFTWQLIASEARQVVIEKAVAQDTLTYTFDDGINAEAFYRCEWKSYSCFIDTKL